MDDTKLSQRVCIACRGDVPPLTGEKLKWWVDKLNGETQEWRVIDGHHLKKEYTFPDFKSALEFVNKIGALAEEQGHHPDIELSWGRVAVKLFTHKINGLFDSDFILAAHIDQLHSY
jgi:4a-hydroxytetrahydrobiopterin dehydratase